MPRRDEPKHGHHQHSTTHAARTKKEPHDKHHGAHHHHHDFSDLDAAIERFEAPERVTWQKPAEVIAALSIARGSRVADLGAGTGYFTIALARAAGPRGLCYAVDTEPAMLAHLRRRAEREKVPKLVTIEAKPDDPCLPGPIDLAFVCNAYHHLGDRARWLERLAAKLAPEGRVAIIDWHKRTMPVGPPTEIKLAQSTVAHELAKVGLHVVERHAFLPHQYFLVFAR